MSGYTSCEINSMLIKLNVIKKCINEFLNDYEIPESIAEEIRTELNLFNISDDVIKSLQGKHHGNTEIEVQIRNTLSYLNRMSRTLDRYKKMNFNMNLEQYKENVLKNFYNSDKNSEINNFIDTIDDIVLKDFVWIVYSNNDEYQTRLNMDEILMKAQEMADEYNSSSVPQVEENNYDKKFEKEVRNDTVQAVLKILQSQGFIVKRKNIIEKEDGRLLMKCNKLSGEEALVSVNLDGKFSYKFHNYKGMTCMKDINEFENVLENVYGTELKNKELLWTNNPDLIGKQSHNVQTLKVRNGGK